MLHLLMDLIVARLKYKPVPFGLLDLLTQVLYLRKLKKVAAVEITGLEIATHWSPMRPEIKRWRLDF